MKRTGAASATSFFLPAASGAGRRFCIYHAPHPAQPCRGAFVYAPPFADEMNRARRMAAMQARAFAAAGFGVLLIDLYGCGDSDGESGDASWEAWKDDLTLAVQWLQQRLHVRPGIWGLRLGALLALDFAQEHADEIGSLLLWNPVLNGQNFLTQFLRLQLAGEMMSGVQSAAQPGKSKGTVALRDMLQAGRTLEIAGYDISPALALRLDSLDAMKLKPTASALHWLEIVRSEDTPLPAAQTRLAAHWQQQNVALDLRTLSGPAFWSTPETTTSPSLIELSCALALADSEQSA